MRTLCIVTALAAASCATLVQAQSAGQPAASSETTVQVPGTPAGRYKMDLGEFRDYSGKYMLSTGEVLTVTNMSKRFYAQIEDNPSIEIVPLGPNVFVARNADMRLLFNEFMNGRVNDVVITSRRG